MDLAAILRPTSLDAFVGQEHLVGRTGIIRRLIEQKTITHMVFWGPPGVGKTTLAHIIAKNMDYEFFVLSAVESGKEAFMQVIKQAKDLQYGLLPKKSLLFIDEIHRWNKAQQDALLPYMENGLITLIGATTENPSFELNNALLSRSRVIILKPLSQSDLAKLITVGKNYLDSKISKKNIEKEAEELLIHYSGGDARALLNALELAYTTSKNSITKNSIEQVFSSSAKGIYDKLGDEHYHTISAFIKSMRGSATEAALYYMHRMLKNGEDPLFIARRMIIFASEDIGMADRSAIIVANSAFESAEKIGMPEAVYPLTHSCMYLCSSSKSRDVANAIQHAQKLVDTYPHAPIPLHLRNTVNTFTKGLGYGKDYIWSETKVEPKEGLSFLPKEIKK